MEISKILSSFRICNNSKSLIHSKLIHQKIVSLGLQQNIVLTKNLINLYFSCRDHFSAKLVLETHENQSDTSLWNSVMAGFTKNFMFGEALELFGRLLKHPLCHPDCYTYPNVLKACGASSNDLLGKMIHAQLEKTGLLSDVVVASSLVGSYAKCNLYENAIQLFDEMPERDTACWNTVISCYYQSGKARKALDLFERMKVSGFEPNSVTLTIAISACSRVLDLERGKKIHEECVKNGITLDEYVSSALVDMYSKCGCFDTATKVFENSPRKNVVAWNSMIQGYVSKGDSESCVQLLSSMIRNGTKPSQTTLTSVLTACSRSSHLRHGKFIHGYITRNIIGTDIFINSSLTDLYFKCGKVKSAENVFRESQQKAVVLWNVMISGYVTVGLNFEALGMYDGMVEAGVKPDAVTFTSVLPACSQLAALEKGKQIHVSILENKLESDELVMCALLDMYAKSGDVEEASRIFDRLQNKDVVSWTSMIMGYGSHGSAIQALKLFDDLQKSGAKADGIAFLAVLSACSHGGFVNEGIRYFNQMKTECRIKPGIEHYSCLIDLLGRAARLSEAYSILQENPEIREDPGLLSTLFSACCLHRNYELGEKIAGVLVEKDPDDPSIYVVLSNLYASVGRWDEVRKVRWKMKELGLRKNPGCSWIEMDGIVNSFFAEDIYHLEAEKVYECVEILRDHMEDDDELKFFLH